MSQEPGTSRRLACMASVGETKPGEALRHSSARSNRMTLTNFDGMVICYDPEDLLAEVVKAVAGR